MKIIAVITIACSLFSADLYKAWDFQTFEQYYMVQRQAEIHERAKLNNPGNYGYTSSISQYYINGDMNVDNIEAFQENTNVGNITEINGDNNTVDQESGEQDNANTIN
jgi:hypothetical protein